MPVLQGFVGAPADRLSTGLSTGVDNARTIRKSALDLDVAAFSPVQ
jgi:hypothetical protein